MLGGFPDREACKKHTHIHECEIKLSPDGGRRFLVILRSMIMRVVDKAATSTMFFRCLLYWAFGHVLAKYVVHR